MRLLPPFRMAPRVIKSKPNPRPKSASRRNPPAEAAIGFNVYRIIMSSPPGVE